jgi:hypothetical protein
MPHLLSPARRGSFPRHGATCSRGIPSLARGTTTQPRSYFRRRKCDDGSLVAAAAAAVTSGGACTRRDRWSATTDVEVRMALRALVHAVTNHLV